jgi:hypothetical protein
MSVLDGKKIVELTQDNAVIVFEGSIEEFGRIWSEENRKIRKARAAQKIGEQRKEWNRQYYLRKKEKKEEVALTIASSRV